MRRSVKLKAKPKKSIDIKQNFLSAAISDISAYIQLADTKVSIIMGALVALMVGILTCVEQISILFSKVTWSSKTGIILILLIILCSACTIMVFVFGILTIRAHRVKLNYKSKWFISDYKSYPFDEFHNDIRKMCDGDIIENMSAELYKLNAINQQKSATVKWTIRFFALTLCWLLGVIVVIVLKVI